MTMAAPRVVPWCAVALLAAMATACGDTNSPKPVLSAAALAKCASRGSPITVRRLVRVLRANGVTLSIKEKTCLATAKQRADAGLSDATNGGPSGLQISKELERKEGFVLCDIHPAGASRKVVVTKYATDTETYLEVLNVHCSVYPSDGASETAQVVRLRQALAALV